MIGRRTARVPPNAVLATTVAVVITALLGAMVPSLATADARGARPGPGAGASRGNAKQVTPTLPPPTTTTTTTPPTTLPALVGPMLPAGSGVGRRVVYSVSQQRVWAVEADGRLVKTHAVSGRRGVPVPGTYAVFSRSLSTNSLDDPNVRFMYMIRFTRGPAGGNIGFHEIPTKCDAWGHCWRLQSDAQLGQPLSGGCIRQSTADAEWMWNWAQLGTTVVVTP